MSSRPAPPRSRPAWLSRRATVRTLAAVLSLVLIVVAWWAVIRLFHVKSYVASSPRAAFDAITQNWSVLAPLITSTVTETVYGFVAGTAVGYLLAVLMSRLAIAEQLVLPTIITSQAVPTIALAPILVLIFGFTLTPVIIVVALFVFFPVTINTLGSLKAVDPELLALTRVLGAKRWRAFLSIEAPASLPGFLSGLKLGSVYAVSGAIICQLYDTVSGNSLAVNQEKALGSLNIPPVYGDTIVMTVLSLGWFLLVAAIGYAATPWLHRDTAPAWLAWLRGRTTTVD